MHNFFECKHSYGGSDVPQVVNPFSRYLFAWVESFKNQEYYYYYYEEKYIKEKIQQ